MCILPRRITLSGGGIRGIAHVGALEALEARGLLRFVKEYCGISAGALIAYAICIGYTLKEIREISLGLDFGVTQALEPEGVLAALETFGFDSGENLARFLRSLLTVRGRPDTLTFRELATEDAPFSLRVFALDLNTGSVKEFSAATTPDVPITLAVQASMSIPIYFTPVVDPETGHLLVDGGVIDHSPFPLLSDAQRAESLAIVFSKDHYVQEAIESSSQFLFQLYVALHNKLSREIQVTWAPHHVVLPCGTFPGSHFSASTQEKEGLMAAGAEGVRIFCERWLGTGPAGPAGPMPIRPRRKSAP